MKKIAKQLWNFLTQVFFYLSCVVFVGFILFFVFKGFLGFDRLVAFKNSFVISGMLEKPDADKKLSELVEAGRIISHDSLFTQTLAYYDTLITILVGILGVAVAGAFFYIRSASLEKSQEYAERHVDNFLESQKFSDEVKRFANSQADSWAEDVTQGFERISEFKERISSLEERVSSLEEGAKRDMDESL